MRGTPPKGRGILRPARGGSGVSDKSGNIRSGTSPMSSEYVGHIRQSRPDSGLGLQVKVLKTCVFVNIWDMHVYVCVNMWDIKDSQGQILALASMALAFKWKHTIPSTR